ncbi:DUF4097 family beta strand repeat-containing protein [Mycolicibacterium goodii]|uniref:DUF4097 family beta strand repeat-containing protein n=1 Tax=Mycolicibacterium goodii TaxID=134601 RepID=UPI001BDCEDDA|nr:DUF4097 family beta strand repeat-containing protein [Mycolicibacterium goodii]MBU8818739.1 DUF4097 domain-containing protein [Mycolicibacterium goodii]MBU8832011.1 DUF4097 domain-containing protein [Mycolicibacterium goodii]
MTVTAPPIEPQIEPPPHLSPGGRTTFRFLLVTAGALVLTATLVGLGVVAWGVNAVRVVTDHQALPANMRSVVIDTARVPIAIRIVADRETREATANLRLLNTTHSGEHRLAVVNDGSGTRITIEGNPSPMLEWARGGEITISMPPEQARRLTVRTEQKIGAVIASADVDQLIAHTTEGAIVLSGAARNIELHTVNGEVVSRDPIAVAERFSATTSDGDITVDFRDKAPRTIDAVSRSGDVVLGLPGRGPYLVHADSRASTQVRVDETTDRGAAASEITARSDSGEVVVEDVSLDQ